MVIIMIPDNKSNTPITPFSAAELILSAPQLPSSIFEGELQGRQISREDSHESNLTKFLTSLVNENKLGAWKEPKTIIHLNNPAPPVKEIKNLGEQTLQTAITTTSSSASTSSAFTSTSSLSTSSLEQQIPIPKSFFSNISSENVLNILETMRPEQRTEYLDKISKTVRSLNTSTIDRFPNDSSFVRELIVLLIKCSKETFLEEAKTLFARPEFSSCKFDDEFLQIVLRYLRVNEEDIQFLQKAHSVYMLSFDAVKSQAAQLHLMMQALFASDKMTINPEPMCSLEQLKVAISLAKQNFPSLINPHFPLLIESFSPSFTFNKIHYLELSKISEIIQIILYGPNKIQRAPSDPICFKIREVQNLILPSKVLTIPQDRSFLYESLITLTSQDEKYNFMEAAVQFEKDLIDRAFQAQFQEKVFSNQNKNSISLVAELKERYINYLLENPECISKIINENKNSQIVLSALKAFQPSSDSLKSSAFPKEVFAEIFLTRIPRNRIPIIQKMIDDADISSDTINKLAEISQCDKKDIESLVRIKILEIILIANQASMFPLTLDINSRLNTDTETDVIYSVSGVENSSSTIIYPETNFASFNVVQDFQIFTLNDILARAEMQAEVANGHIPAAPIQINLKNLRFSCKTPFEDMNKILSSLNPKIIKALPSIKHLDAEKKLLLIKDTLKSLEKLQLGEELPFLELISERITDKKIPTDSHTKPSDTTQTYSYASALWSYVPSWKSPSVAGEQTPGISSIEHSDYEKLIQLDMFLREFHEIFHAYLVSSIINNRNPEETNQMIEQFFQIFGNLDISLASLTERYYNELSENPEDPANKEINYKIMVLEGIKQHIAEQISPFFATKDTSKSRTMQKEELRTPQKAEWTGWYDYFFSASKNKRLQQAQSNLSRTSSDDFNRNYKEYILNNINVFLKSKGFKEIIIKDINLPPTEAEIPILIKNLEILNEAVNLKIDRLGTKNFIYSIMPNVNAKINEHIQLLKESLMVEANSQSYEEVKNNKEIYSAVNKKIFDALEEIEYYEQLLVRNDIIIDQLQKISEKKEETELSTLLSPTEELLDQISGLRNDYKFYIENRKEFREKK